VDAAPVSEAGGAFASPGSGGGGLTASVCVWPFAEGTQGVIICPGSQNIPVWPTAEVEIPNRTIKAMAPKRVLEFFMFCVPKLMEWFYGSLEIEANKTKRLSTATAGTKRIDGTALLCLAQVFYQVYRKVRLT
jgi:hypothetical protein